MSVQAPLLRAFDHLRRILGSPFVYAVPKEPPEGLTYDDRIDSWVDGSGDPVTRETFELLTNKVPALWGADTEGLNLTMGGIVPSGDLVAIAKFENKAKFDDVLYVATGTLDGDRYNVDSLENAPDGSLTGVFVVVGLGRK